MNYFVTGFHRAGTHTIAQDLASKHGLLYFEERRIRWDSMGATKMLCNGFNPKWEPVSGEGWKLKGYRDLNLDKGFVLHCPGIAHKTLELAEMGTVYWCVRDRINIATSMVNSGFERMTWHLMKQFHEEFPDDPIWSTLEYDGHEDVKYKFVAYHSLFLKVKDYFYETKFKDIVTLIKLEEQPFYNESETSTKKAPLREEMRRRLLYAG